MSVWIRSQDKTMLCIVSDLYVGETTDSKAIVYSGDNFRSLRRTCIGTSERVERNRGRTVKVKAGDVVAAARGFDTSQKGCGFIRVGTDGSFEEIP